MDLYLVRHGQTDWNLSGRYQGWADRDLDRTGVAQAWRTAAYFATAAAPRRIQFAAIYSSPLRRARRTATCIGQRVGLEPVEVPDLREMYGGQVEGLTRPEWEARFPALRARWDDAADAGFAWPGGETRQTFRARVGRALGQIVAAHRRGDQVIVVTHGGVIAAYLWMTGLTANGPAYPIDNCSITRVQLPYPGAGPLLSACVQQINGVGHLAAESDLVGVAS